MATLNLWYKLEGTLGDQTVEAGTRATPTAITVGDDYIDLKQSLADTTTWDAWTSGSETAVTTWEFLFIEANVNVFVELTCDKDADNGTVVFAKEVTANHPFMLSSDDAKANYTADFAGGTDDVIDRIRIRNESGGAGLVRFILFSTSS